MFVPAWETGSEIYSPAVQDAMISIDEPQALGIALDDILHGLVGSRCTTRPSSAMTLAVGLSSSIPGCAPGRAVICLAF